MKKKVEEFSVQQRMGFGEPISDAVDSWGDSDDQALKSARTLFEADDENIKLRTDLSADEVRLLSLTSYYHRLVGIPDLDAICLEYMKLKVSQGRKSREEFVKTASSSSMGRGVGGGGFLNLFNKK